MAHGLSWRTQALVARLRPPSEPPTAEPVGDSFRTAVLASYEVDDISQLNPTQQMWAEFTLTTVERGMNVVELLGGRQRFRRKRVLDVGCAYGGFLIAARRSGAKEIVGIDVDPRLLGLARLLMADHRMEARLEIADVADPHLADRLGSFDIVFCNDVLEHVQELEGTARNLSRLLNPGGRLFLEIPNGAAINYIESDGHYKLPGITLLDHTEAERWFRSFYADAYPYNTYFYASVDYYLSLFSRQGLSLRFLNAPVADQAAVGELAQRWQETYEGLANLANDQPGKPPELIDEIQRRADEIDVRFNRLLVTALTSPIPEEREVAAICLQITFGLDSFLFEGTKPRSTS